MLRYFHSWNEFESFCITVTKQYLTCRLRGEEGAEQVVFWLVGISGTSELNDAVGWDKIRGSFPALVKQVSDLGWMILKEILWLFRTKVL